MAYCNKCGAYIPDGQSVCLACGYDPEAEKNPTLDTKWRTAKKGEYSDYKIVMTPCEYKLEEGHVLKLYLFAQDPVRSRRDDSKSGGVDLAKKDEVYSFKIDNTSVEVFLPLR